MSKVYVGPARNSQSEAPRSPLYSGMSHLWFPRTFAWITPLMGGDFGVRQWHHIFMWFFTLFTLIHVYLVFYHDYIEGRGTTSSMVGGWKFEGEGDKDE